MRNHAIAILTQLYGDVLYQRDGMRYPFVIHPAPPGTAPDDLLGGFTPADHADFAAYDAAHLAHLCATRPVTNGLCYRAARLEFSPPRLHGELGHYFDMLATCDAFTGELYAYERGEIDHLPLRDAFHARIAPADCLQSGVGRSAIIGVATLTIYRHADDYRVLVAQRGAKLATGANRLHVIPAFVLQPNLDPLHEWSVHRQILREYGEELFGVPEFHEQTPTPSAPDYFMAHPAVAELAAMLDDGRAELRATGITQNLFSTRFELCTLLVIHDADWRVRHADALHAIDHERQVTYAVPVDTLAGLPADWQAQFVPQGLGAFFLGVDAFRANP